MTGPSPSATTMSGSIMPPSCPTRRRDGLVVAGITLLSTLSYVSTLGFYADDWAFLSIFTYAGGRSLEALVRAARETLPSARMRPVQQIYLAALYCVFGDAPLGYHIVNACVLAATAVTFYLVLRELGVPRSVALAVPLVFGTLPHYATVRMWLAAFQITLSVLLFFLSVLAELKAVRGGHGAAAWKAGAIACLLASSLAYEVAMPLFLFGVAIASRRSWRSAAGTFMVLVAMFAFKAWTTDRAEISVGLMTHIRRLAEDALWVHFISYGAALPRVVWRVVRDHSDVLNGLVAIAVGLGIFVALRRATDERVPWPSVRAWGGMFSLGVVVFALGYAIFLSNHNVGFTKTGIHNRTAIAAAVGIAFAEVAALGAIAAMMGARTRPVVFAGLAAALGTSGVIVVGAIGSFWGTAWQREQAVLTDIRQHVSQPSPGVVLILDGVCPYVGPAVVFESYWDLTGALQLAYGDPTLRADVVSPRLRIAEDALVTSIYKHEKRYPFGERLLLYDFSRKELHVLRDAALARTALDRGGRQRCPPGEPGYGIPIF